MAEAVKQTKKKVMPVSPGRPKGSVNKTTALLKDAILMAAQEAGGTDGMVGYLRHQAMENPGPFMTLLGKVLPTQIAGDPENPLKVIGNITITPVKPKHIED
jgi:hypothetical protein